ncbi:endolytic transglycosylase MltG, partial [Candidatus Uhrbacteria bacterium]|nr:endolytic transglycosylase MltG [Candidatus Uhrbacteria bacterium]
MRMDSPFQQPQGILGFAHARQRSRFGAVLRWGGLVVLIAAGLFAASVVIPQRSATTPVPIALTSSAPREVTSLLRAGGVLRFPRAFRVLLALRRRSVMPGAYVVSPHLSVWSLAQLLTTTRPRPERTLRIIEGWTLRDIAQHLEREGAATADEVYATAGAPGVDYRTASGDTPRPRDFASEFSFLTEKPEFVGLEGYLFPDTYRVYADASMEDIIRKMLANFDRKMTPELRNEIASSGRSLHQIITMASIIEAEVPHTADRPVAAGLLWKRRDRGMLLQVDASVNYVTGKRDPRVSRNDAAVDSAYNTYRYPGLPR